MFIFTVLLAELYRSQMWDWIRITGVDYGRILRFSSGHGPGPGVKILGSGVTFDLGSSRSLYGYF